MTRAVRLLAIAFVLVLAACETPNARLVYAIANDGVQACGSSNCAEIEVPCPAVISIRILKPGDPTAPEFTICEPLPQNKTRDLCAISSVDLGDRPLTLPKETLEVQMVIWPRSEVETETGDLDCAKHEVVFDAVYGFPISQTPAPAIGGHTYYHPGDEEIRVTLGCTNLESLDECTVDMDIDVAATVENFESVGVFVSDEDARRLTVAVGEPTLKGGDTVHSLASTDTRGLTLQFVFVPIWRGRVNSALFNTYICVDVLEGVAQSTAALHCSRYAPPAPTTELQKRGVYVPRATLGQILAALGLGQFPPNGVTIGIVVDSLFNPLAGEVVSAVAPGGPTPSIRYLSADRTNANGVVTSPNGIFISEDAPFGTEFSVAGSADEIGGLVQDKVTVVVIQKP